jgi:hypothetical protein
MARTHRVPTTAALIVCLMGTPWTGTLFASDEKGGGAGGTSASSVVERSRFALSEEGLAAIAPVETAGGQVLRSGFRPVEFGSFAQRGRYRGRGSRGGNGGSQAAIVFGAVASVAGGALLVYANRPECRTNERATGCGYGYKVVGGAVLSAGVVSLVAGALIWR